MGISDAIFMLAALSVSWHGISLHVHMNISNKTTRPRDVLLFLKDALFIADVKLFKAHRSVCLFPRAVRREVPPMKV